MATLAEQMKEIVEAQGLSSLGIYFYNHEGITPYFYCYAHAEGGLGAADGLTPVEAVMAAIADLNAKRHQVVVPELVAA